MALNVGQYVGIVAHLGRAGRSHLLYLQYREVTLPHGERPWAAVGVHRMPLLCARVPDGRKELIELLRVGARITITTRTEGLLVVNPEGSVHLTTDLIVTSVAAVVGDHAADLAIDDDILAVIARLEERK